MPAVPARRAVPVMTSGAQSPSGRYVPNPAERRSVTHP
jgi:hypothetical protein